jgi:hypothetical protein
MGLGKSRSKLTELMEIKTEEYSVRYDETSNTVYWTGIMRLTAGQEYEPILQLVDEIAALGVDKLTLNFHELTSINSYGISMLVRFIFAVDSKKNIELLVQGAKEISWQEKWANNFQRLMPKLQIKWD